MNIILNKDEIEIILIEYMEKKHNIKLDDSIEFHLLGTFPIDVSAELKQSVEEQKE